LIEKGSDIGGVYDPPEDIGFLGYLNTKLPEKNRKEQMEYFKKQAKDLMEIRKSGHLPDDTYQKKALRDVVESFHFTKTLNRHTKLLCHGGPD